MSPARRSRRRQDWPRGLYEPRPGYFVWRHPTTGETLVVGRVPLAVARNEALAANAHVAGQRPGLLERLTGSHHTIADVLDEMPTEGAVNTLKSWRSLDKRIRCELGAKTADQLTVKDCAAVVEALVKEGKVRMAQALRSRLIAVCKRGMGLGWMESNPADATTEHRPDVKRGRLTLEAFEKIRAKAGEVSEWLELAMLLALVTGQDRSTVAAMERDHIEDGHLTVWRTKTRKTNQPVDIPLALRLEVVGLSLADLVQRPSPVAAKRLVHHVSPWGNAPPGSPVHPDTITRSFTAARELAGIPDAMPDGRLAPTFHEIRSLSKRLYERQGGVDTKALLGHSTERAADLYADPRGIEHIRVRLSL